MKGKHTSTLPFFLVLFLRLGILLFGFCSLASTLCIWLTTFLNDVTYCFGSITKLRYMVFREMLSSSRTLGFRIEGIKLGGQEPLNSFKTKREFDDVADVMRAEFLPQKCDAQTREKIRQGFHSRLLDLRDTMASSRFFQNHELIGTSLLFVYDLTGNTGVWMIDFGKTIETESPITHTTEWTLGNHEDGYLLGLETITRMFSVY